MKPAMWRNCDRQGTNKRYEGITVAVFEEEPCKWDTWSYDVSRSTKIDTNCPTMGGTVRGWRGTSVGHLQV
jgi:hypothetical protein